MVDTHISWVLLTGNFAYKLKKPAQFDFLDFSTLQLRKKFCNKELELNKRLAPHLYQDVLPVFEGPALGPTRDIAPGDKRTVIEYLVKMIEFPSGTSTKLN